MKRYVVYNEVVFSDKLTPVDMKVIELCNLGQETFNHRLYKTPDLAELTSTDAKINKIFQNRVGMYKTMLGAGKYVPDVLPSPEDIKAAEARSSEIEGILATADELHEKELRQKRKAMRDAAKVQADKAFA